MEIMLMSILTRSVILKTTQNYRTTCATACRGSVVVFESHTYVSESIQVWCLNHRVSICAGVLTVIVGNDENHIPGFDRVSFG